MKKCSIQKQLRMRIVQVGIITFFISLILSFSVWLPSMWLRTMRQAKNGNEEIVRRMDTTISFLENYTENLALSISQNMNIQHYFKNPTEKNKNLAMISLSNLTSYEGMIRAVFIETNRMPLLDSLSRITDEDYALLDSEWYSNVRKAEFCSRLSPIYRVTINHVDYSTVAYARKFYQNNQWFTFVIFASLNDTLNDIRTIGDNIYDYYILRDTADNIFFASGNEHWMKDLTNLKMSASIVDQVEFGEGTALMRRAIKSNWRVISLISNVAILRSLFPYFMGLLIALSIFLFLIFIVLSHSLGKMIRPIVSLSKTMEKTAEGNLTDKVIVTGEGEIGILQNSYNKMLDDLHNSFKLIAEKEHMEQQFKFSLLVSQINPHFIFNTINSINYLARQNRCEDVVTVNRALMAILRDRLRVNSIEITDTIEKEIKVVEEYIKIQHFMYLGDIKMIWEVDDSLLREQIPKNMIQPLVENALFHGLINEENGELNGEIKICIERVTGGLMLSIQDNGIGMDEIKLQQVKQEIKRPLERGSKIGLSNIYSRLSYLYADDANITVRSELGKGTCVSILFLSNKKQQGNSNN